MPRLRTRSDRKAHDRRERAGPLDREAREKAELAETEDFLACLGEAMADDLHPDQIGVRRAPEPKSIHAPVACQRFGSIEKPKSLGRGKITEAQPYTYTREMGMRHWRQRG